ncbi:MAG: GNAT family N-acetyltransferase [Spirochaeta sp.]
MKNQEITIRLADFSQAEDAEALIGIMESYAAGENGDGKGLSSYTRENLARSLHDLPHAFTLLAFVHRQPAGLANCFMQFSTFSCRPILNLHDLAVLPEFQGRGIGGALLDQVTCQAEIRGCCKVTLEVLSKNFKAQRLYQRHDFTPYQLSEETGHALFWEKPLTPAAQPESRTDTIDSLTRG